MKGCRGHAALLSPSRQHLALFLLAVFLRVRVGMGQEGKREAGILTSVLLIGATTVKALITEFRPSSKPTRNGPERRLVMNQRGHEH